MKKLIILSALLLAGCLSQQPCHYDVYEQDKMDLLRDAVTRLDSVNAKYMNALWKDYDDLRTMDSLKLEVERKAAIQRWLP